MLSGRNVNVKFTYDGYQKLVAALRESGYVFCQYSNVYDYERTVIMRHDVDLDLDKACKLAALEERIGVASTYFVFVATDFYNAMSKSSRERIRSIISMGHDIGLHFDETQHFIVTIEELQQCVTDEARVLSHALDHEISAVSMHRPSQLMLRRDVELPGFVNSYSSEFFVNMKYLSDSRMSWREDVFETITRKEFDRLHILTHPFWYSVTEESLEYKLRAFLNHAAMERYDHLDANFRDLNKVLEREALTSG